MDNFYNRGKLAIWKDGDEKILGLAHRSDYEPSGWYWFNYTIGGNNRRYGVNETELTWVDPVEQALYDQDIGIYADWLEDHDRLAHAQEMRLKKKRMDENNGRQTRKNKQVPGKVPPA